MLLTIPAVTPALRLRFLPSSLRSAKPSIMTDFGESCQTLWLLPTRAPPAGWHLLALSVKTHIVARFRRSHQRSIRSADENAPSVDGAPRYNSLTMSYFHTGTRTIIGAEAFHCPVRDGKEWDHLAMVIRHNFLPCCQFWQQDQFIESGQLECMRTRF